MKNTIKGFVYCSLLLLSQTDIANSATVTDNLAVSATVAGACTINSVANLDFGAYTNVQSDTTADINYTCTTPLTSASVNLGNGNNYSANRRLESGGNYLTYTLYSDAGRTVAWTSDAGDDQDITANINSTPTNITVYGRIAAGAGTTAGTYSDSVVVTVTYN